MARKRNGESDSARTARLMEDCFERCGQMVYRRALVILGRAEDAEDAVQEVFLKAFTNLDRFRGEAQTATWLYRITTNHCLNELRNKNRRAALLKRHLEDKPAFVGAPDPADTLALRKLLAAAEPDQAQAAVYVYIDGMTRPEAAGVLGVSLRTVGNLLQRFRDWARDEFADVDAESNEVLDRLARRVGLSFAGGDLPDVPGSGVQGKRSLS